MANYTAADVKRLRELTGAGMMNCKKALEENDGDFDKAVEFLRIKGAKDVGKRAERATAEGLVAGQDGVLIELDSETDFVAKNEDFQALAAKIVEVAKTEKTNDVEKLKAASLDGKTVDETVQEMAARIGEKLELRRVAAYEGTTATYLHRRGADLPPAVGVLIEYTGEGEAAAEAARGAAMQVAALKAKYLTREEVPAEIVENERRVAEATAREEGKPEQAMPKIIEGKVNAYYKDNVLLEQPSVKDNKKTVKALLDEAGVTVSRFARFEVGQA
ncbi:translation elongation factor Ts [Amycolatopsis sp. BJA-103]|uniref:translation elongation factor Ts n=1 Tax=unclassified Amycolatopsis TaxID=2618356 RepID=UPI000C7570C4|nr:translation elongation factor Ts [Amycolatopsis sp. BJA-103]AUI60773.1 translation elongation factor Ts [Amycolatopsis sp. BJA-103]PNE21945.1 translation elongation factor Ts [Amycolatopsis sp. BJA-103]